LRFAQNLAGIQMFGRSFYHAQDGAPLLRHADSALAKVGLQPARHFRLGKRHAISRFSCVATGRNRGATVFSAEA
jgi:hypothetical protein